VLDPRTVLHVGVGCMVAAALGAYGGTPSNPSATGSQADASGDGSDPSTMEPSVDQLIVRHPSQDRQWCVGRVAGSVGVALCIGFVLLSMPSAAAVFTILAPVAAEWADA
jgi:hypothetical protein